MVHTGALARIPFRVHLQTCPASYFFNFLKRMPIVRT